VTTAPYSAQAAAAYGQSIEHAMRAQLTSASGVVLVDELDVTSCTVTLDEGWSPLAQVQLVIAAPKSADYLDQLDGRKGVRLLVDAGYVYPGGSTELHRLADVRLRERVVTRPVDDGQLVGVGDELRLQEDTYLTAQGSIAATTTVPTAITQLVTSLVPGATVVVDTLYAEPIGYELTRPAGVDVWRLVEQLANAANLWVYVDELRRWRIADRATLVAKSSLIATTGYADSTLTRTEAGLSASDDWANAVLVTFDDGTTAYAQVVSGPLAVSEVPRKVLRVDGGKVPAGGPRQAIADSLCERAVSRGNSLTIEAPAAYWIRPGQTISVQLPTGPPRRELVARVAYALHNGRMTITTRQPDGSTITTGE
jgi:hypothetical protein